jgi:5-oxoprolinase (ATP-hydrolysing)
VFYQERIVAYVGAIGHVTDIGGTKRPSEAQELYEEGIQIPPMKLYKAGRPNEDLFALLKENVRDADMVVADIQALATSSGVGARRLQEFLDEYQLPNLSPLGHIFHKRSEIAMREAIRAVPNGTYESEISGLIGDNLLTFPVKIDVADEDIVIDLEGAPPEALQGGYNCTLNYTMSHSLFPLKCLLTPGVRGNSGCYRPFTVKVPEGTLLNCRKPASVSTRQATGWFLGPNTFSALSLALPDRVRAFSGMPGGGVLYGANAEGDRYIGHIIFGGGQGGSAKEDGRSGLLFPIGGTTGSTELLELRVQVVVAQKQFDVDSAGPGKHRGGLGQLMRLTKVPGDNRPLQYVLLLHGENISVPPLLGGRPGRMTSAVSFNALGPIERDGEPSMMRILGNGEAVEIRTAGGDGHGDPLERDLDLIRADIDGGYVSAAHAEDAYGCVFDADGALDTMATARHRNRLRNRVTETVA